MSAEPIEQEPIPLRISASRLLSSWLDERVGGEDIVELPELAKDALEHFRPDQRFLDSWFTETVYEAIYRHVQRKIARTRLGHVIGATLVTGQPALQKVALRGRKRWLDMFEHTGTRMVRLRAMTRPDLIRSADEDEKRGGVDIAKAALKRRLANGLHDDAQTVEQAFSEEEVAAVASTVDVKDKIAAITAPE